MNTLHDVHISLTLMEDILSGKQRRREEITEKLRKDMRKVGDKLRKEWILLHGFNK